MIYYFIPGGGIFGGVKVACQFTELLISLGVPATIVSPDGRAPQWFPCQAPVISERAAIRRLTSSDVSMITWPPDYQRLRTLPGRLVCHCQGTDRRMDEIFLDATVPILTCWKQAEEYAAQFERTTIDVGISISDRFFYGGEVKIDDLVAYMPRRGFDTVRRCLREVRDVDYVAIDGLDERTTAARLKRAGIFLATAEGEEFGLPALEALAAGCVVLSVPVKGGMEYLQHEWNSVVVEPDGMAAALESMTRPGAADRRTRLRSRGVATACRYLTGRQRRHLTAVLTTPEWRQALS